MPEPLSSGQIAGAVSDVLQSTAFIDMHTHLFQPSLGKLGLWGIDELVTYHYLEAELFRSSTMEPAQYFSLSKRAQADLIWKTLFVDNAPISEATRGVVAVLQAFGLPTASADLTEARRFFESQNLHTHIGNVLQLSGVSDVVMTNDPLDPKEAPLWAARPQADPRFHAVLRLDRILNKWSDHWEILRAQGYSVDESASESAGEVRRFLERWITTMKPVYAACSLPDTFAFPEDSPRGRLLADAVLPVCRQANIPLSLMIGVRYLVNPDLRLAGDASGLADLRALETICRRFPANRFLVSLLSRENQHELCVYARKFRNMMPFGCWWFLNNPSVVEEVTRERVEMLGASFIPQHSDARVLEQLIYKWRNTRRTLAPILTQTYSTLAEDGRPVTKADIEHDVKRMFRGNFTQFAPAAAGR
ncbi:MAG: glucuronate isomerase [Bryobacteraceae bacterium]|nr:glucuronate isomerase [Bryobacteraceae bacterium]